VLLLPIEQGQVASPFRKSICSTMFPLSSYVSWTTELRTGVGKMLCEAGPLRRRHGPHNHWPFPLPLARLSSGCIAASINGPMIYPCPPGGQSSRMAQFLLQKLLTYFLQQYPT
jgi:hypothetical protein